MRSRLLLALICAVAVPASGAHGQTAPDAAPADDAIRAVWAMIDATWYERDVDGFSELFAEDASFEFVDRGESLEGRATIRGHYSQQFPRIAQGLRHVTTVRETRAIAPDVQAMDGTVEIVREANAASAETAVLRRFAIFAVMLNTPDGWSIHMLRVFQTLPPAAASQAAGS